MKLSKIYLLFFVSFSVIALSSCDDDDPVIPNEEEIITTLNYTLTPQSGGNTIALSFQDLDGDGGNAPMITGGTLQANTAYNGTLDLLNEAATPTESITDEINAEKEDHQFFFSSTVSGLNIFYNDQDADTKPVGLASTVATGPAGTGTLTVILRHEPDKSASGVADGDISNAGGETDIEVTFDITVQ